MERLREIASLNPKPAVEIHIFRRYIWEALGFACLVVCLIAFVVGGFLI